MEKCVPAGVLGLGFMVQSLKFCLGRRVEGSGHPTFLEPEPSTLSPSSYSPKARSLTLV